jgi:hypothetical protein
MRRPVEPTLTYQSQYYSGRVANYNNYNAPALPPAVGPPPLVPGNPNAYSYRQQPTSTTTHHQYYQRPPPPPPPPLSRPEPRYPELRHKTGRVYNSSKSRNPPTKPQYQEYLDAMDTQAAMDRLREVKERKALEAREARVAQQRHRPLPPARPPRTTSMMRDEPKPHRQHHSSWIMNKAKKVGWTDTDSDDSFVCRDARAVSDNNRNDPRSTGGGSSSRRRLRKS